MAALTKTQFYQAAINELALYPTIAQLVKAGDPRVLAQLGANASMLAMLSAQVDVDKYEPFLKARDGTVLADAALKGILPLGRAAKLTLSIENSHAEAITLQAQRRLLDPMGRIFELDSTVSVAAGESATVTVQNIRRRSISHTVDSASDFYRIQITESEDLHLNTLSLSKGADEFTYAPDWFNVGVGEYAYQVEVDELRKMYVRLGKSTVIGYGAQAGDEFTIDITECDGRINDLHANAEFNLEYVYASQEVGLKFKLIAVDDEGSEPHSIQELRVMAAYPAVYDHNAVYLGEFGYLLRRYISGIRFLSVWTESVEESARGASEDNINAMFVSGLVMGMTDAVFRERAANLIGRADNSYRIRFVDPVKYPVPVTISAAIAISWDLATVEAQIRALILDNYGDGAVKVSRGMSSPIKKRQINELLRDNIDALRDERAEYGVDIVLPAAPLPEHFLCVTPESLTVSLSSNGYAGSLWNH